MQMSLQYISGKETIIDQLVLLVSRESYLNQYLNHIVKYLAENDILFDTQNDFRENRSCLTNLLRVL